LKPSKLVLLLAALTLAAGCATRRTPAPVVDARAAAKPLQAKSSGVLLAPKPSADFYTVKRGDTLYSIARTRYGDGKQWQRIAAANPGVSPAKLLAGQTIVLP
jgi:5'-nucleotidase